MSKILPLLFTFHFSLFTSIVHAAGKYDNPDTIVVARDGTGEFRTVDEAIEVCRAFMDYHKVIITCEDGIFDGSIELRVHDRDDVRRIIDNLKKIPDLKEISEIM